jgi:hypothetical protein
MRHCRQKLKAFIKGEHNHQQYHSLFTPSTFEDGQTKLLFKDKEFYWNLRQRIK